MNCDEIEIRRLEVSCHIGVPEAERAVPQKLWISIWMEPSQDFDSLADEVRHTVDYAVVADGIRTLAEQRRRCLIETLATDAAHYLLSYHPLKAVTIQIEKRILPKADCVAVKIRRERF